MTARDAALLRRARALIADPKHWCQNVIALNAVGEVVSPMSKRAAQWCLYGALDRVTRRRATGTYGRLYTLASQSGTNLYDNRYLTDVNDKLGHAAVLAVLDEAARMAEAEA